MSKVIKILLLGVALLVASFFVLKWTAGAVYFAWFAYGNRGTEVVQAKLQKLRDEGLPVDNATMQQWYDARTDATDTDAWLKILKTLQSPEFLAKSQGLEGFDKKARDTRRTSDGWPGEQVARKLLAEAAELRVEIRTLASKRAIVQFPLKFDSINTSLDHIQAMRQVARLLSLEADAAIQDRNSAEILASSQALLDLAIIPAGEASILSRLVGIAFRGIGLAHLKNALEHDLLDSRELELLGTRLPQEPLAIDQWKNTIQIERAIALPVFLEPLKYMKDQSSTASNKPPVPYQAAAQDILHYLEFMEQFEDLGTLPMADAIKQSKAMMADLEKSVKDAGILGMREWMLTGLVTPALETAMTAHCRDRQQVHIVLHGVAIRRYQDQFGDLPQDLLALKAIGFDTNAYPPIGSMPFGYLLEADGATLWGTDPLISTENTDEPPTLDPANSRVELVKLLLWKLKK